MTEHRLAGGREGRLYGKPRMRTAILYAAIGLILMTTNRDTDAQLIFSVRSWEGEYSTHDVAHGVAQSAHTDAMYVVNADGTALRELKPPVKNPYNPAFSPDGQWIYFQSHDGGDKCNIYRCRGDGTGVQNLTKRHQLGRESFGFSISRDGKSVAFVSNDGKIGRIAIMAADGTGERIVAPNLGYHYMGSFSPDGKRLVFSHTAEKYRLKLMDLRGEGVVNLTPDAPESFCGQFTPDGRWIVFFRRDGEIYRVREDGKSFARLTTGNGHGGFKLTKTDAHGSSDPPDISPDGLQIAHCGLVNGVSQVFVMNLDGRNRRKLTTLPGDCGRVEWSPDGKQIAIVSFVGDRSQLFVINTVAGQPKQLTQLKGAVNFLNWKRR